MRAALMLVPVLVLMLVCSVLARAQCGNICCGWVGGWMVVGDGRVFWVWYDIIIIIIYSSVPTVPNLELRLACQDFRSGVFVLWD